MSRGQTIRDSSFIIIYFFAHYECNFLLVYTGFSTNFQFLHSNTSLIYGWYALVRRVFKHYSSVEKEASRNLRNASDMVFCSIHFYFYHLMAYDLLHSNAMLSLKEYHKLSHQATCTKIKRHILKKSNFLPKVHTHFKVDESCTDPPNFCSFWGCSLGSPASVAARPVRNTHSLMN